MKSASYISLIAVVLAIFGAGSADAAGLLTPKGQSSSLAIRDHNVKVVVDDGYVLTEINRSFFDTDAGQEVIKNIPQRRIGEPADLDGTLLLLAGGLTGLAAFRRHRGR